MKNLIILIAMLVSTGLNAQDIKLKKTSITTAGLSTATTQTAVNISKWQIGEVYLLKLQGNELPDLEKEPGLSVYPNPFRNDLSLQIQSEKLETCSIQITDLSGKVCKQIDGKQFYPKQDVVLDLTELNTGMYLLSVSPEDSSKKWMVKLVKN